MDVRLDWRNSDREETLTLTEGETVREAAVRAGVGLPFGCETGACGTCTARLLDGEIAHQRPPRALKERHLKEEYILTCIGTPTGDAHLEVGAEIQADLVSDPWK
jgi:ferredoxin